MANYFVDTEFMEDGRVIELVSIGIVDQDGTAALRSATGSVSLDESTARVARLLRHANITSSSDADVING